MKSLSENANIRQHLRLLDSSPTLPLDYTMTLGKSFPLSASDPPSTKKEN